MQNILLSRWKYNCQPEYILDGVWYSKMNSIKIKSAQLLRIKWWQYLCWISSVIPGYESVGWSKDGASWSGASKTSVWIDTPRHTKIRNQLNICNRTEEIHKNETSNCTIKLRIERTQGDWKTQVRTERWITLEAETEEEDCYMRAVFFRKGMTIVPHIFKCVQQEQATDAHRRPILRELP
jgi:hypothetical protein